MWPLIERQPRPAGHASTGHTPVGALDAVAFPMLSALAVVNASLTSGVVGAVVAAVAVLAAISGLSRSLWQNERY